MVKNSFVAEVTFKFLGKKLLRIFRLIYNLAIAKTCIHSAKR